MEYVYERHYVKGKLEITFHSIYIYNHGNITCPVYFDCL